MTREHNGGKSRSANGHPEIENHLNALSHRIRALRARRGMTRKDLAKHSGISERYLAQLELAEANPSIALLWRIAYALDLDFLDLVVDQSTASVSAHEPLWRFLKQLSLTDQQAAYELLAKYFGRDRSENHGVAMIGLRGAGKTTLGRLLAERQGVPFVRIGDVIAELGGMQLSEIFSLGGQKTYRRLEKEAVERTMERHPQAIVEAGGSLVSQQETFDLLRSAYFTVWVRAAPEDHMNRVVRQGDTRPMEGNSAAMDDLRRILSEREVFYRSADYAIYTTGRTPEECLEELAEATAPYLAAQPTRAQKASS